MAIELWKTNDGDKEFGMRITPHWIKIDRDGNVTIKGKIIPGSNDDYQENLN